MKLDATLTDKAILAEDIIGAPVEKYGGEKIDLDLTIAGRKYEVYRSDDNYTVVENGRIRLMADDESTIQQKLFALITEEMEKPIMGTQNAESE